MQCNCEHHYKGFHIQHVWVSKPTPRFGDWTFYHDEYDPTPDANDDRAGYGATLADCIEQIDDF